MANYTYILSDFPNNKYDLDTLSEEIIASSISSTLDYIDGTAAGVDIYFLTDLSGGDQTTLDTIVANHTGIPALDPVIIEDLDVSTITGNSGTFQGDYRINGKLWVETIRRVKQETNQMIIRVEQENALGGGNIAGMIILDPTGSTTGWTTGDTMPYYIVGVDKDGVLVAGWSGDTQPVVRGSSSGVYGAEFQIASALAETTTTSATPQTKVTLTTTDLPSGTYKIFTAWLAGSSSAQQDMIFDVTLNGTPQGTNPTMNIESKDTNTTNTLSRTFYLPLSGVNDIVLRYSSEGGNTTSISDATIELIRVE
jgi:hypothetical protein